MNSFKDLASAHIEAGLSLAGQFAPKTARKFTHLTEPTDVVLRWHVARHLSEIQEQLCTIPSHPGAKPRDLTTWGRYILAAETDQIKEAIQGGKRRLAMAHLLGTVGLVGLNTDWPPHRKVYNPLPPEPRGLLTEALSNTWHSGIVVRVGDGDYIGGFGTVSKSSVRDFQPIPTLNLGSVQTTPNGLCRI